MSIEELSRIKNKENFLNWFVSQLIIASKEDAKIQEIVKKRGRYQSSMMQRPNPQMNIPKQIQYQGMQQIPQNPQFQQQVGFRKSNTMEIPESRIPFSQQIQPMQSGQIRPQQMKASTVEIKAPAGMTFDSLLQDRAIKTIEATAGESISILRNNMNEKINLSLTDEDIRSKVEQFSQKTKIPVSDGIFDASLDNLHVNAFLSDVIPSRLLINKSNQD